MLITSIYTLTIFTSAFLLFLIQPMIPKLLLPHLGESPAVWNTTKVFFLIMLLLSYTYAHFSNKLPGATKQVIFILLMLLFIPVAEDKVASGATFMTS